jgi:hypothetical protein
VRQQRFHEEALVRKCGHYDQAKFMVANVKDQDLSHEIRRRERIADVGQVLPGRTARGLVSNQQLVFGLRMLTDEPPETGLGDHVHRDDVIKVRTPVQAHSASCQGKVEMSPFPAK